MFFQLYDDCCKYIIKIGSVYGIATLIWLVFMVDVGKYLRIYIYIYIYIYI